MDDETFEIHRFEVGVITNNNRRTIISTNDLDIANSYYEVQVSKCTKEVSNNHNIVFIYDYDKNANINYYDSRVEFC